MANKELGRSLENLLVAKNRRLLDELTKLRVSWEELSSQHVKAEDSVEGLQLEINRLRGLNEKLENDLMSLNKDGGDRSVPAIGLAGLDIGGKSVVRPNGMIKLMTIGRKSISKPEWRFLHLTNRHLPKGSIQTAKRRTRRGELCPRSI